MADAIVEASPLRHLERMVEKILVGEAIFFIGAGFSVDSEGNATWKLIQRLLLRFAALVDCMQEQDDLRILDGGRPGHQARALHEALFATFFPPDAHPEKSSALWAEENVTRLSQDYYAINDWMCNAFGLMLADLEPLLRLRPAGGLRACMRRIENWILEYESGARTNGNDPPPEDYERPMDLLRLLRLPTEERGKALFLDAMGFASEQVMAGQPFLANDFEVQKSFDDRLRERHWVLAWLAREGLTPILLTTNYDLLLDGAYRLSGMAPIIADDGRNDQRDNGAGLLPPAGLCRFLSIAGATTFFSARGDPNAARILKIHGCAHRYRVARRQSSRWRQVLPAMVFTYREIQNWRQDTWSRDYVSSLLRTNSMIFWGYSGSDPVLHDTVRGIYEEMRERVGTAQDRGMQTGSRRPLDPAFFVAPTRRLEFHGLEILRSASRVGGEPLPRLEDNENYLRFRRLDEGRLPNTDDMLLWIHHRVVRELQRKALETHLPRVFALLFGHPPPPVQVQRIRDDFDALCGDEQGECEKCGATEHARFRRLVDWTRWFRYGLMREFALAEAGARHPERIYRLSRMRDLPWYHPSAGNEDLTAFSALLELALRRLVAAYRARTDSEPLQVGSPYLRVERFPIPSLAIAVTGDDPQLARLRIQLAGERRAQMRWEPQDGLLRAHVWTIEPDALPWVERRAPSGTPSARRIWDWACGRLIEPTELKRFLGRRDDE